MKVFENRVRRSIFGSVREEVAEDWRRLHVGKLINFTLHQTF
jgi:hypothetical protein